jgi:hypothetical protein
VMCKFEQIAHMVALPVKRVVCHVFPNRSGDATRAVQRR